MMPVFHGAVREGQLQISDPTRWRSYLASLNGKRVAVLVEKETTRRSTKQNAWYWGVIVPMVQMHLNGAREIQLSKDQTHYVLKSAFIGMEETPLGPAPLDSRTLTIEQFSDYCTRIVSHAGSEWGLHIPSPDEVEVSL